MSRNPNDFNPSDVNSKGRLVIHGDGQRNQIAALIKLEREGERRAWIEEVKDRRRRIVTDTERVFRRAREIQAELAPSHLSPDALSEWTQWRSRQLLPGPDMRKGIEAERRLAPEAIPFEERMHVILQKYANVPLGEALNMTMPHYWTVLDVAAEAVEQEAYPGTVEARKRYALALRRCARELRDTERTAQAYGNALHRALVTLQLSLDDGTLSLWSSSQALIDFVGRKSDGTSQSAGEVTSAAWQFVWDYAVVARLRQVCAERFARAVDNRAYVADENGRLLGEHGRSLVWTWDGHGSGVLSGDASINVGATSAFHALTEDTGLSRVLSGTGWEGVYEKTPEYRAFVRRTATFHEMTAATACEALADVLEQGLWSLRLGIAPDRDELNKPQSVGSKATMSTFLARAMKFLQGRFPRAPVHHSTSSLINTQTSAMVKSVHFLVAHDTDAAVKQSMIAIRDLGLHGELGQVLKVAPASGLNSLSRG